MQKPPDGEHQSCLADYSRLASLSAARVQQVVPDVEHDLELIFERARAAQPRRSQMESYWHRRAREQFIGRASQGSTNQCRLVPHKDMLTTSGACSKASLQRLFKRMPEAELAALPDW